MTSLPLPMVVFACLVVGFSAGICFGCYVAESSAVQHSDCDTAHHMKGKFYYIVPEAKYCEMTLRDHPWREDEGGDDSEDWWKQLNA